jgi:sigma-B regulation protein RsbU (phosphoserine phosphatase)
MNEEYSQKPGSEPRTRLECSGVWGGVRNCDLEIRAGRVVGSLYSAACDGGRGGDIYYFGVCRDDRIMRLAIADVLGHGEAVAEVGQFVYESLRAHMCDVDSEAILGEINRRVGRRGLEAMTTAAVVAHDSKKGMAYISYAGHPPVLYKCKADEAWSFASPHRNVPDDETLADIPLAVDSGALYRHIEIQMASGDRLFVYTDGITEAPSPEGDLFGEGRLKDVLDAHANASLSELKSAVLQALLQHTRNGLTHDDVTLIALEIC